MKTLVIALALAGMAPGRAEAPPSLGTASLASSQMTASVERRAMTPEPSAWLLGLTGILAIGRMWRRRR